MKQLALAFLLFPVILLAREEGPAPRESAAGVRIGILSKQLRFLTEGALRRLEFSFPPGSSAVTREGAERALHALSLVREEGRLIFRADGAAMEWERFTVNAGADDETFSVEVDGRRRWYPLPLEVRRSGGAIELVVSEDPARYAADSAMAEYGTVGEGGAEALAALSLLIEARLRGRPARSPHGDFDFCDLTHCQVYRGRLTEGLGAGARIECPPAGEQRFFFHARCGGATLDARAFGGAAALRGVRDRVSWSGEALCGDAWECAISERELAEILLGGAPAGNVRTALEYSRKGMAVRFSCCGQEKVYAPESFRLAVNRVKGWSFLKSNNYRVASEKSAGIKVYRFRGSGLGHGVGFCQTGALALARRGYSRHEILAHYFPGITFTGGGDPGGEPGLSHMVFSLHDGAVVSSSHDAFERRSVPAGSLFKLIVALYLASERNDLLTGWRHTCARQPSSPGMPGCWHPEGHGPFGCREALAHSCNSFFASLHERIDQAAFREWAARFSRESGIDIPLPRTGSNSEWAHLLAGLDTRVRFTVAGIVRLARLLGPVSTDDAMLENIRRALAPASLALLRGALHDTIRYGTAAQGGARENGVGDDTGAAWGKTATAADGTNRLVSYGIFIGGDTYRGVVVVLRNARGSDAAARALGLL